MISPEASNNSCDWAQTQPHHNQSVGGGQPANTKEALRCLVTQISQTEQLLDEIKQTCKKISQLCDQEQNQLQECQEKVDCLVYENGRLTDENRELQWKPHPESVNGDAACNYKE